MQPCEPQALSAYLDDELDQSARLRVERHLRDCPSCAHELRLLKRVSEWASNPPADLDLTTDELTQVHDAIDEATLRRRRVLRLCGVAGVIAASLLIISGTWLAVLPTPTASPASGTTVALAPASSESWEQVATTLRVRPLVDVTGEQDHTVKLADARFADWMLHSLSGNQP